MSSRKRRSINGGYFFGMLLKKLKHFLYFSFVLSTELEQHAISRSYSETFLAHYEFHLEKCVECKSKSKAVADKIRHFLLTKKVAVIVNVIEAGFHIDSKSENENSLQIIEINYKDGCNSKIIPGFRDYRGEVLLYEKATDKLHQIRSSLRLYDEMDLSIDADRNISMDCKIFDNESRERYKNENADYIISPKIDGALFLIVAITSKDPLYNVIMKSDLIKKYKFFYEIDGVVYIFSTRKKFLNIRADRMVFEIIEKQYQSYENLLKKLGKYVQKENRMCFCFESVQDPTSKNLSKQKKHVFEEKTASDNPNTNVQESKEEAFEALETAKIDFSKYGVILFRIIEFNDKTRREYPPSFLVDLDKDIVKIKEVHLKGLDAVKKYIAKSYSKLLEGQSDFENSVEGHVLDDGQQLIKLKLPTYLCLHGKNKIATSMLYDLMANPIYSKLLNNMRVPVSVSEQFEKLKNLEEHFHQFFHFLTTNKPDNNETLNEEHCNALISKAEKEGLLPIVSLFSSAINLTNERVITIGIDLICEWNKSNPKPQPNFNKFMGEFIHKTYAKVNKKVDKKVIKKKIFKEKIHE